MTPTKSLPTISNQLKKVVENSVPEMFTYVSWIPDYMTYSDTSAQEQSNIKNDELM